MTAADSCRVVGVVQRGGPAGHPLLASRRVASRHHEAGVARDRYHIPQPRAPGPGASDAGRPAAPAARVTPRARQRAELRGERLAKPRRRDAASMTARVDGLPFRECPSPAAAPAARLIFPRASDPPCPPCLCVGLTEHKTESECTIWPAGPWPGRGPGRRTRPAPAGALPGRAGRAALRKGGGCGLRRPDPHTALPVRGHNSPRCSLAPCPPASACLGPLDALRPGCPVRPARRPAGLAAEDLLRGQKNCPSVPAARRAGQLYFYFPRPALCFHPLGARAGNPRAGLLFLSYQRAPSAARPYALAAVHARLQPLGA